VTWFRDPKQNRAYAAGEVCKIRWEVIGYCHGEGLDLGCGPWKVFSHALGIDRGGKHAGNIEGSITDLSKFADNAFDYVFSSHALEDIADTEATLSEWMRVIRPGGHLVLYLPHKAHYPNLGHKDGNPAHKHDFEPEDIVKAMQRAAPDWALVENQERADDDEYSFLQVYRKRKPGSGQGAQVNESDPAKRCIVMRYGGFGDVLIAASTFPHLKAEGWHITVYTGEKGAEVLRHDPHVDRVVVHDFLQLTVANFRTLAAYLRGRCARFVNFSETFEGLLLASPHRASFHWSHDMRQRYMSGNYLEAAHTAAGVPHEWRQQFHHTARERAEALAWRAAMPRLAVLVPTGSGVNKQWPGAFEYAWRLVERNPDLHVAVLGDTYGAKFVEHARIHDINQTWPVRRALALAQVADLVIGQETGILNAVAFEPMPKIVLLSHSSAENLTLHWFNTATLAGDVPCYPCHRLHHGWDGCNQDPQTQLAACQAAIPPMRAIELTARLMRPAERAAA